MRRGALYALLSCALSCHPTGPNEGVPEPSPRAAGGPTALAPPSSSASEPAASSTSPVPTVDAPAAARGAAWLEIAPAVEPGVLATNVVYFAEGEAAWRCVGEACQRFDRAGASPDRLPLPCALKKSYSSLNLFASPRGTSVAVRCGAELVSLRLDGKVLARLGKITDQEDVAVDDDGTLTVSRDLGKDRHEIRRRPAKGRPVRVEVSSPSPVLPGVGDLLAWTPENSPKGQAWFRGAPPIIVPFSGLAMVNGSRLWVSFGTGGYARREGPALQAVSGDPRGALPPHGLLMTTAPWGAKGLLFAYERAVLLLDEELETVSQVELPIVELKLRHQLPGLGGSAVTTNNVNEVFASPSGRTLFARLPDGSIRAIEVER
jgi:hypothetical protein